MNILGRNYIKSSGKLRVVREKNKIVIENNSDIKQKLIFYKSIKTDNKRLTINSVSFGLNLIYSILGSRN